MVVVCQNCRAVNQDPGGDLRGYRCGNCGLSTLYRVYARTKPAGEQAATAAGAGVGAIVGALLAGGAIGALFGAAVGGLLSSKGAREHHERGLRGKRQR